MFTTICFMVLAYWILGKDVKALMARVKNVDWHSKASKLYDGLRHYALKSGRVAAKPLLQFYYVMNDEDTSTFDKVLIYAAIMYTLLPFDLVPSIVYEWLGILDDGLAILYVYKKIKDKITPQIEAQVNRTLNDWFGMEYEVVV
jgi:uncharacterized membrane protein YkvA (DUF1232 family)